MPLAPGISERALNFCRRTLGLPHCTTAPPDTFKIAVVGLCQWFVRGTAGLEMDL